MFLAAIGPKNTTLAAEIADGWIPTLFSPEHVAEFRPLLEEGFARAGNGKGFDDFEIAPTVNVFVTDDVAAARDAMRPYVALYVGGMGSRDKNFYNALVQRYGFEDAAREVQDLYLEGKRDEAAAALPEELIDTVSLCGPPDVVRERLAVFRDAGVGTLMVSPMAWTFDDRIAPAPARRRAGGLKVLLGAFGDPGHAFPMLALGEALVARGHSVALQTWRRWQEPAEAAGMEFAAAPEYQVFPTSERPLQPYAAAVRAAVETRPVVRDVRAGRGGVGHPDPGAGAGRGARGRAGGDAGAAPVSALCRRASRRTRSGRGCRGRRCGARSTRSSRAGSSRGGGSTTSAGRGWASDRCRTSTPGISRSLALVATAPQLEYPRDWPSWVRVVGPLLWEPPSSPVAPPGGSGPVVLVAPSTAQDPSHRLLRAALEGLADEPVRVIATWNGREASLAGAGERRGGAVAVVLGDDAGLRPGGHARRPRDADAGAVVRLPGGGLARRRGHGRERGAGRLGGRRRAAADAVLHAARGAAGGAAGVGAAARAGRGGRALDRDARRADAGVRGDRALGGYESEERPDGVERARRSPCASSAGTLSNSSTSPFSHVPAAWPSTRITGRPSPRKS